MKIQFFDSLTRQDSIALVVGAGLITHPVFKRTETHEPLHLMTLLVGVPAALTALLSNRYISILTASIVVFTTFWTSLLASIGFYRLAPWHPLFPYSGPFLCKLSKFRFAVLSTGGKQHILYTKLHEKYGDVVRVGPNEISIRDVRAVEPLLGPSGLPKGPFWDGRFAESDPTKPLVALRSKAEHTRRRRPWTRAFSTAALKEYELMIKERSQQLSDHLSKRKGPLDLMLWLSYFSFDLMGDFAFGGGTEFMRDGDIQGLWHLVEEAQESMIFMSHVPWLGQLMFRLPGAAGRLKEYRMYCRTRTMSRKTNGSPTKDLFYYLFGEDGFSKTPPPMFEVISDGGMAILAGSDTTSTALSNLFFLLLTHPDKYKRLREEIDQLGEEKLKDCTAQAKLPYLTAAINESMRLYPPVLSGSQRYADKSTMIGPYFIPEGTTVFIPFYALHRDPRYFAPLPDAFLPERWLPAEDRLRLEPEVFKDASDGASAKAAAVVVLNTDAFVPFSLGPANCVGKNFAWMEMRMVVCLLVERFEMRLREGYDAGRWEEGIQDFFVTKKGELPVVLTARR